MKLVPLTIGFFAGFLVATIIGMTWIIPFLQSHWTMNVGSDYCRPLSMIHQEMEATARAEKSEKTLAQLRVLNQQFVPYRVGGPTPHEWWDEVVAAKQPATRPATLPVTK